MSHKAAQARTCSAECFRIRKYRGDQVLAGPGDVKCARTGCFYSPKSSRKDAKFCSGYCKTTHDQDSKIAARPVKVCAWLECDGVASVYAATKYCSRACRIRASNFTGTARRYGLTNEQVDGLDAVKGGDCWVCSLTADGRVRGRALHTDHDHSSGKGEDGYVRGRVCQKCNTGLGVLDDAAFVTKAAAYLTGGALSLSVPDPVELRRSPKAMKSHGISREQFDVLAATHGGCWICHKPETTAARGGGVRLLAIDHDHSLGKGRHSIRGLLCMQDNQRLHYLEDAVWMAAARTYLETSREVVSKVLGGAS